MKKGIKQIEAKFNKKKQDDGLTKREWFELFMLVFFCLLAGAGIIAFIVACLRLALEHM